MVQAAVAEPTPKVAADGRINVVSPLDARLIERLPATDAAALPALATRARAAQAEWAARTLRERATVLRGLKAALAQRADGIVEALRVEIGRHPAESWFAEIVPNLDLVEWWCRKGIAHLETRRVPLNPISYPFKRAQVAAVPRGLLGMITPWNYPVAIPMRALVPALLSGNAVLWKPSEYAALVAQRLYEVFAAVLPTDLLVLVQGDGRAGAAVLDHVDGIGFVGSLATGQKIGVRAAERMIPASLELGGKDFAVVLADANLERAAAGIAWAALSNAGQNCAAVEVVCVHEAVAPRFQELLRDEVRKMAPFVGPLVNEAQKRKVVAHIEDAQARGALVREGGVGGAGLRVPPTLLERVDWQAKVICEETFGPVIPVMVFRDLDEVGQHLGESAYGLTLSLWTRDTAAATRWASGRPVGVVAINNHAFTAAIPALPWTGVKGSGLGVTNGPWSLDWMVRPQGILVDRNRARELWWHPFNDAAIRIARAMTTLNSGVGAKVQALGDLLGGMLGRWREPS